MGGAQIVPGMGGMHDNVGQVQVKKTSCKFPPYKRIVERVEFYFKLLKEEGEDCLAFLKLTKSYIVPFSCIYTESLQIPCMVLYRKYFVFFM